MKTVTGLFDNYEAAKDAVARRENAGFPSDDISIVSHHRDDNGESNAGSGAGVGASLGAVVGGVAGGLIGALTESGVSEEDTHLYAEGVRRGGSLVTARVADERVSEADAILAGASPVDIDARRKLYVQEGWQRFDANADPYTDEEIERERSRYL